MTKSSDARKARRAQHEPEVTKARSPMKVPSKPTSVIQFEQLNDQGGFTFNLGLYGALLAELNPDRSVPVSVVDVMALAIAHLIRTNSKELQDACELVRGMLGKVHDDLEAGKSVEEVLRDAEKIATVTVDALKEFGGSRNFCGLTSEHRLRRFNNTPYRVPTMSRKKSPDGPVHVKNPRLQHRLPREDNAPIVPFDDPPNLLDMAEAVLGPRFKSSREGFFLDGKLCNLSAVLKAANLKCRDE